MGEVATSLVSPIEDEGPLDGDGEERSESKLMFLASGRGWKTSVMLETHWVSSRWKDEL